MTRRQFAGVLGLAGLGGAGLVAGGIPGTAGRARTGALLRSGARLPTPYTLPFAVPPVARPDAPDGSGDRYTLVQRVTEHEILPGTTTRLHTYGGTFPGPTIVARRDRPVTVVHRNLLDRATVTHLHGGHTPPDSDGFPTDLVSPGADRVHTYPMRQRAATLWYHDHTMARTARNVWHGLAGFHLVHDDEEDLLDLPAGERDIPVMLTDRAFDADGSLRYPPVTEHDGMAMPSDAYRNGVLGDVLLVNGVPWPVLEAPAVRHRFRLLNASNARTYRLALDPPPPGGHGFAQVGSDGGLLDRPVGLDTIELAPAERFDVVVNLGRYRPGTVVDVVNEFGDGSMREVMRIRVGGRAADPARVPSRLGMVRRLDRAAARVTRDFAVRRSSASAMWTINDRLFDPDRTDAGPALGATELWRFTSDLAHPVHLHLDPFQVLSRGRPGALADTDGGWKDTVRLLPTQTVELLVRFTDYTGRYVFHCHNLEHEDMGMMATFRTG